MLRRVWLVAVSIFSLILLSQYARAAEISSANYTIYSGDVNGDGMKDFVFSAKRGLVILHGKIATPIVFVKDIDLVIYREGTGYSSPVALALTQADIAARVLAGTLRLAQENTDYFVWKNGASAQSNLLLRGGDSASPALLLTSYVDVLFPAVAQIYSPERFEGISSSTVKLTITDVNGDGRKDILLEDQTVAAWKTAYLADASGVPIAFKAVAASATAVVKPIVTKPIEGAIAVGTTAYSASVNNKGEAIISVPINLPQGVNGMRPELSLDFNSGGVAANAQNQGAYGWLGFGWGLSGISNINRCTIGKPELKVSYDPVMAPTDTSANIRPRLTYTDSDSLCLNGELLVLVGGTHFQEGAQYHTYMESFKLITIKKSDEGDLWFEVRNPNGKVAFYGNDSALRIRKAKTLASPNDKTSVFQWAIAEEKDSFGNTIKYNYYPKDESFSYQANTTRVFPFSITYPGGSVYFNYQLVSAASSLHPSFIDDGAQAGVDRYRYSWDASYRQLTSISVQSGRNKRSYTIAGNQTDPQTPNDIGYHGLQVGSIKECVDALDAANVSLSSSCYNPLTFRWDLHDVDYDRYKSHYLVSMVDGIGATTKFNYTRFEASSTAGSGGGIVIVPIPASGLDSSSVTISQFLENPYEIPLAARNLAPGTGVKFPTWQMDKDNCAAIGLDACKVIPPITDSSKLDTVVFSMERSNGLDATSFRKTSYSYLRMSARSILGFGSLGFGAIREKDEATGVFTYKQYDTGYPFDEYRTSNGRLAASYKYSGIYGQASTTLISKAETRHGIKVITQANTNKTYLPTVVQHTNLNYEKDVFLGGTVKTNDYVLTGGLLTKITSQVISGAVIDPSSITEAIWWGRNPLYKLSTSSIKTTEITETLLGNSNLVTDWRIGYTLSKEKILYNGAVGAASVDSKSQKVSYILKPGTMAIESATLFKGDSENELVATYVYDSQGRQTSVTNSGKNIEARTSKTEDYTLNSIYPSKVINPLGHTTTNSDFDARFNLPKTIVDANNLTLKQEFDSFGRLMMVTDVDGVSVTQVYKLCPCDAIAGQTGNIAPTYYKEIISPISPKTREYYDVLGRVVRTEKQGFVANETIRVDTQYDKVGRIYKVSLPYKTGATPQYTTNTYDNLNRLIKVERPNGGTLTTEYTVEGTAGQQQLVTTTTEKILKADGSIDATAAGTRKKISYFNSVGQLSKTTDVGTSTTYQYDALGNISKTTIDGGVDGVTVSTAIYDNAGRRTSMTDPNAGTITSKYTAVGQVRWIKDNKGNEISFTYDLLGRQISKTSIDGISNWVYDPVGAKGNLSYSTNNNGYKQTYYYEDNYRAARLSRIETSISIPQEIGLSDKIYINYFNYDVYGRIQKTVSPSGFASIQNYNAQGYPSSIYRGDGMSALQITRQLSVFGIESESFADGSTTQRVYDPKSGLINSIQTNSTIKVQDLSYKWRSNGSLESRTNSKSVMPVTDFFSYDSLDRLTDTNTSIAGTPQRTLTQAYNNLGNIKSNISNQPADAQVKDYKYDKTLNAGPHAVTGATINGMAYTLGYDKNGAIELYDATGAGQDKFIAYNATNQPTKITVGATLNDASPVARDEFRYAPDGTRYYKKSTYKEGARSRVEHTFYVGGYETTYYDTFSTLKQTEKTPTGSSILSIRKTPYNGPITVNVEVLHRDHLGSVDAVTQGSTKIADLAFEPFGARRSSSLLTNITVTEMTNLLAKTDVLSSQSYTGHESLDRIGFIHMNGRMYDPQLGRFLSPDPLVQSPTNSQSWNRYSYVFNNPLKYTDPTGLACLSVAHYTKSSADAAWSYSDTTFEGDCQSDEVVHSQGSRGGNDNEIPVEKNFSGSAGVYGEQQSVPPAGESGGDSIATQLREAAYSDVPCLPGDSRCDYQNAGSTSDSYGFGDLMSDAWGAFNSLPPQMGPGEVKLAIAGGAAAFKGAVLLAGRAESSIKQVYATNLISQQSRMEMSGSVIKRLVKDMKINGFDQSKPISAVVRGDGRLVISDGHHRVQAAIRAGIEKIPVDIYNPFL